MVKQPSGPGSRRGQAPRTDDAALMQRVMFQMMRYVKCPICGDETSAHPGWVDCLHDGVKQLREALAGATSDPSLEIPHNDAGAA